MPTLSRKEHVVLVDAYSGGRNLIPAFQALGYPVIHVQWGAAEFHARDMELAARRADRSLVHTGDVDGLVRELRAASACVVLPGSEGGVLLADELADRLDLPFRNPVESSLARRDKFEMQERLRLAGLPCIAQARITDEGELDAWLKEHGAYPVVLKPLRSAGTDGVFVCTTAEDARAALRTVLAARDMFGDPNEAVLCQEFLSGTEYVLNGVACGGRLSFSEGWRSDKADNHGFTVYDTQYLFCPGDTHFDVLSRYVAQVCDTLGITNGAFHAEVMLTGAGPVLIEIGARPAGGADPYVVESCLGPSQLTMLVDAALHQDRFEPRYSDGGTAAPRRRAAYVYLIATGAGRVGEADLEPFLRIDGVVHAEYRYRPGDRQVVTRDLLTAAGVVLVTAPGPDELVRAVRRIRRVEQEMLQSCVDPEPAEAGNGRATA
ncbi:ATP-grasp domain-containing protein [Streptomyces tendae]|uniref:ATP-grasp domain-containing protein n=1 Tax=Streptomyces tendae TaxID=1932 RepID=UPI00372026A7